MNERQPAGRRENRAFPATRIMLLTAFVEATVPTNPGPTRAAGATHSPALVTRRLSASLRPTTALSERLILCGPELVRQLQVQEVYEGAEGGVKSGKRFDLLLLLSHCSGETLHQLDLWNFCEFLHALVRFWSNQLLVCLVGGWWPGSEGCRIMTKIKIVCLFNLLFQLAFNRTHCQYRYLKLKLEPLNARRALSHFSYGIFHLFPFCEVLPKTRDDLRRVSKHQTDLWLLWASTWDRRDLDHSFFDENLWISKPTSIPVSRKKPHNIVVTNLKCTRHVTSTLTPHQRRGERGNSLWQKQWRHPHSCWRKYRFGGVHFRISYSSLVRTE